MSILAILGGTPLWVWLVLAAAMGLGALQMRPREVRAPRVTVLPVAMAALSVASIFGAFGGMPWALAAWLLGFVAVAYGFDASASVRGAAWLPESGRLRVPGSRLPFLLIVGIFTVKYLAGVSVALRPLWSHDPAFAGGCSLLYGIFSGAFWGRARALRRLVRTDSLAVAA
jgi:hypothetical protein